MRTMSSALLLVMLLQSAGCYNWNPIPRERTTLEGEMRPVVRVTLKDGTTHELARARITADSVFGEESHMLVSLHKVAVSRDSVVKLEHKKFDGRKSGLLALGMIVGVGATAAAGPGAGPSK